MNNFTLSDIKMALREELQSYAPALETYSSKEEFVNRLYEHIAKSSHLIRSNLNKVGMSEKKVVKTNILKQISADEEGLTFCILLYLKGCNLDAHLEPNHNGHCDLTVTAKIQENGREVPFVWKAESKIHKDHNYVLSGIEQLMQYCHVEDRYAGLIVFYPNRDTKSVFDRFCEDKIGNYSIYPSKGIERISSFELDSIHAHHHGMDINVRVFAIPISFVHYKELRGKH